MMEIAVYILKFISLFWGLSFLMAWIGILLVANFSHRYRALNGMPDHNIIIIWPSVMAIVMAPHYMVSIATLVIGLVELDDEDIEP